MRSRTWAVGALLFGSGFCALVYQVAWFREFRLIFGASTAASAAVLAIFIGGLGVGGLLLGPRADRARRPLTMYAALEGTVALSAAASPLLLGGARALYLASGGSATLGSVVATLVRLLLSVVVLALPTLAMGGTLPAAARAATRATDTRRQDLAALYALNTMGAVAGALLATFALLEIYGTRTTIWLAAAVNLLVAMIARMLDEREGQDARAGIEPEPSVAADPPAAFAAPAFVLAASALVGFAFFLMELVWYRLLAPLLGGSVFTFGLVLAVALAGIGLGGLVYALFGADRPATLAGFAASCLLEAVGVAFTFALGDRVALLAFLMLPLRGISFATQTAAWTVVTTLVVLPPAFVAGYQFPLLIALLGRGRERVGRQVGLAYAANTGGAIVGSLAGGFGVLPWLSATGAWRLVAIVLLLLGLAALALAARVSRVRTLAPQLAAAPLAALLVTAVGPTAVWRHSGIGAGRAPTEVLGSANDLRHWTEATRASVVWEGDGTESGVALALAATGYSFIVNGKSDGSARGDAGTQVMLGLLGAIRNPNARRALVVGLGTGSTGGWLAAVPTIERVDVVELEPLIVDVAKACEAVNHDALANPKLHVTIGDAREVLLTARDQYDVIASEPSNPFRAGIASLFTRDFYAAAASRLSENGVFAQWVQGYEIDSRTLQTIYATMLTAFPSIETWQTNRGDLVLLGTRRPRPYDGAALAKQIAGEPFRSALVNAWRVVDVRGFLAHYIGSDGLARLVASGRGVQINTDDRNVVEFGMARSVGQITLTLVAELRALAQRSGSARPAFTGGGAAVAWDEIETARVSYYASQAWFSDAVVAGPPKERARQQALLRYYDANDVAGARQLWASQDEGPRDPTEIAMLAALDAESASDAALPMIERLRAYQPGEADTLLASLRFRQGRVDEAAASVVAALTRLRTDPWPMLYFKQVAIRLAERVGSRDQMLARQMLDALGQPFSVRSADEFRLTTAAQLARQAGFGATCRGPIGALEPHVPWTFEFLTLRRDCYRAAQDPRAITAERDLRDFLAHEPAPLAVQP